MHIYRRILPPFLIRFKLFTVDCILSFLDASADINPYFPYTKTIMNWRNTLLHPDQEPMDEASLQLKQELHEKLNSLISAFNRCAGQRILNPIHIDNFIVSIFKQNYYFLKLLICTGDLIKADLIVNF